MEDTCSSTTNESPMVAVESGSKTDVQKKRKRASAEDTTPQDVPKRKKVDHKLTLGSYDR